MKIFSDKSIIEQNQCTISDGKERLWGWFELSYASFLVIPRVLMHSMPDDWQNQMASLLEEYQDTFPNQPHIGTRVQATKDEPLCKGDAYGH
ncbi:MAG: hypothetical protein HN597_16555 [Desulfobacula sp.]|jgi:hypothetical protein|uniref:hypothetical protein n=1 Tax=Desulfobacula sp. TaxID=2593537 RepID=UPI0039B836A8|nr:hypothetical protein [Desulfobacula sp.]